MNYIIADHKCGIFLSGRIVDCINKTNNNLFKYKILKKYHSGLFYKNKFSRNNYNKFYTFLISKNEIQNYFLEKTSYLFSLNLKENQKNLAIIRNPKEIIISGYLFHLKTNEKWCVTKGGDYYEDWYNQFKNEDLMKYKKYIEFGKTFSNETFYQSKLKQLNQIDGIIYEMQNVSYITLSGLKRVCENPNIKKIKFENLVFDYDNTIDELLDYFEFNSAKKKLFKTFFKKYSLNNSEYKKKNINHITNLENKRNRFQDYWNLEIEKKFNENYPNLMKICGY
jgi:hypothetical protein